MWEVTLVPSASGDETLFFFLNDRDGKKNSSSIPTSFESEFFSLSLSILFKSSANQKMNQVEKVLALTSRSLILRVMSGNELLHIYKSVISYRHKTLLTILVFHAFWEESQDQGPGPEVFFSTHLKKNNKICTFDPLSLCLRKQFTKKTIFPSDHQEAQNKCSKWQKKKKIQYK